MCEIKCNDNLYNCVWCSINIFNKKKFCHSANCASAGEPLSLIFDDIGFRCSNKDFRSLEQANVSCDLKTAARRDFSRKFAAKNEWMAGGSLAGRRK